MSLIEETLEKLYPLSPIRSMFPSEMQSALVDIIHQACRLSLNIQRDVVSSQLFVTITPASSDILGTYSFGLQKRIIGLENITLLETKEILLSSFFPP